MSAYFVSVSDSAAVSDSVAVIIQVDAHGLFGKHHRHVELAGHHGGNANAAGLDGEHLVDGLAIKQALPLPGHLLEQREILAKPCGLSRP